MNYKKKLAFVICSLLCGCQYQYIDKFTKLSEYNSAICNIKIGPFEYSETETRTIMNNLFVSINKKLESNGYNRTIELRARGLDDIILKKRISIVLKEQSIFNVMTEFGSKIGMNVSFQDGFFLLAPGK